MRLFTAGWGIRGDSIFTHENTGPGSVLLFRRNGTYVGTPLASRRGDRMIVAFLPGSRSLVRIGHRPGGTSGGAGSSGARGGGGGGGGGGAGGITPADSDSYQIMDSAGKSLAPMSRGVLRYDGIRVGRPQPGVAGTGNFAQPFYHPIDAAGDPSGLRAVVVSEWDTLRRHAWRDKTRVHNRQRKSGGTRCEIRTTQVDAGADE